MLSALPHLTSRTRLPRVRAPSPDGEPLQTAGLATTRYGLAPNLLSIGRLKFEDYEVENIRPLITQSPLFAPLVTQLGKRKLARLIGATGIVVGSLIAAKPFAPRVSALGSLAGAAMFATTLSFVATTSGAWQEKHGEPKLAIAGQYLVKDIVLPGAYLLTAGDSLHAARRS